MRSKNLYQKITSLSTDPSNMGISIKTLNINNIEMSMTDHKLSIVNKMLIVLIFMVFE